MMASLMIARFHSSPTRPRAMALEFSAGPDSSVPAFSAVIGHLRFVLEPGGHQPLMDSPGAQQLCVPLAIRSGVVLDQPVEQEPARFVGGSVIVPVGPSAEPAVDRAELRVAVRKVLLAGRPGDQNARPAATLNIGGSLTTAVSFVVTRGRCFGLALRGRRLPRQRSLRGMSALMRE
jgi:hypothetical protein